MGEPSSLTFDHLCVRQFLIVALQAPGGQARAIVRGPDRTMQCEHGVTITEQYVALAVIEPLRPLLQRFVAEIRRA